MAEDDYFGQLGLGTAQPGNPLSKYGITDQSLASGGFSGSNIDPNSKVYLKVGKGGDKIDKLESQLAGYKAKAAGGSTSAAIMAQSVSQQIQSLGMNSMSYQQARALPGQWFSDDQKMYRDFLSKAVLYKLPGASSDMGVPEAMSVWDDLLKTSIMLSNTSGKKWTPWDVLNSYNRDPGSMGTRRSGDWLIDVMTGEKVKYVGPTTKKQVDRQIDLSSPEEVQALTSEVLARMLGRAPSDKELAQYKSAMNAFEEKHPEVVTQIQHIDPTTGEVVSTDTKRAGGVSAEARQALVSKQAKKGPEYGKYQAGTTYFNALLQMLGGS